MKNETKTVQEIIEFICEKTEYHAPDLVRELELNSHYFGKIIDISSDEFRKSANNIFEIYDRETIAVNFYLTHRKNNLFTEKIKILQGLFLHITPFFEGKKGKDFYWYFRKSNNEVVLINLEYDSSDGKYTIRSLEPTLDQNRFYFNGGCAKIYFGDL